MLYVWTSILWKSRPSCHSYRPQGKVMFSEASVCPQSASWLLALLQRGAQSVRILLERQIFHNNVSFKRHYVVVFDGMFSWFVFLHNVLSSSYRKSVSHCGPGFSFTISSNRDLDFLVIQSWSNSISWDDPSLINVWQVLVLFCTLAFLLFRWRKASTW